MVQRELEKLGEIFGGNVCLLMPNPQYAGRVEAEVRENRALWESIYSKIPSLFISREPLSQLTPESDGHFFVPFEGQGRQDVQRAAQKIRTLADETISWDFSHQNTGIPRQSLGSRMNEAIELKPGAFGIRIDLKKVFRR